jgi:hypothetical protein
VLFSRYKQISAGFPSSTQDFGCICFGLSSLGLFQCFQLCFLLISLAPLGGVVVGCLIAVGNST